MSPQMQSTIDTRFTEPNQFVRVLLGTPSEAEIEERYLELARTLLVGEKKIRRAA